MALGLSACGDGIPRHDYSKPSTISPDVYKRYTAENGYAKTVKAWGKAGIDRIQKLREAAAEKVAAEKRCDAVEVSDLSPSRSTPPDRPVVFVICKNYERYFVTEDQLGYDGLISEQQGAVMEKSAHDAVTQ